MEVDREGDYTAAAVPGTDPGDGDGRLLARRVVRRRDAGPALVRRRAIAVEWKSLVAVEYAVARVELAEAVHEPDTRLGRADVVAEELLNEP